MTQGTFQDLSIREIHTVSHYYTDIGGVSNCWNLYHVYAMVSEWILSIFILYNISYFHQCHFPFAIRTDFSSQLYRSCFNQNPPLILANLRATTQNCNVFTFRAHCFLCTDREYYLRASFWKSLCLHGCFPLLAHSLFVTWCLTQRMSMPPHLRTTAATNQPLPVPVCSSISSGNHLLFLYPVPWGNRPGAVLSRDTGFGYGMFSCGFNKALPEVGHFF